MNYILNFIGTGGAFSSKYVNNSAYYLFDNKMILFDCGETVFHEISNLDIIDKKKIDSIDIIITHFHCDHVGSLGSLIFYCRFKEIKEVNVIFPIKELPLTLLKIFGISEKLFRVKVPSEVDDYYLKEYTQVHGDVDLDGNIIRMPSYGYHLILGKDNFFYSGDTSVINEDVLKLFEKGEIEYMYHEVTDDGYKAHLQLEELVRLIKIENRDRIICMHLSDSIDTRKIKKLGFRSVR